MMRKRMRIRLMAILSGCSFLFHPLAHGEEAHLAPVTEKCGSFVFTKTKLPEDKADYGFDLSFTFKKKKPHTLTGINFPVQNELFLYPKESICSLTPVYPRKDGTFWILATQDEPPSETYFRAFLYSPKTDSILKDHRGVNFYKPVRQSGDDVLYGAFIPRSDLGGGRATFEGKERVCHETELPLIHRVSFKDGQITDRLDVAQTYELFAYKSLFKDQKEFEAYFALGQTEASHKIRRWVYALDSLQYPDCIFATADNKRDCSDLKPEAVHCKTR